jgi:hypothetical protein
VFLGQKPGWGAASKANRSQLDRLEAGELKGVSVWFDRDSNGASDAGEVVSVESLGITALATRATGYDGPSPMCVSGLKLQDGRTLPTYDWIAPAVEPEEARQPEEPEDLDKYLASVCNLLAMSGHLPGVGEAAGLPFYPGIGCSAEVAG